MDNYILEALYLCLEAIRDWFFIMMIANFYYLWNSQYSFWFIYNRIYIQNMIKNGFKVKSYTGNKKLIEEKAPNKIKN